MTYLNHGYIEGDVDGIWLPLRPKWVWQPQDPFFFSFLPEGAVSVLEEMRLIRGLPEKVSPHVKGWHDYWGPRAKDASWLTVQELQKLTSEGQGLAPYSSDLSDHIGWGIHISEVNQCSELRFVFWSTE